MNGNEAPKRYEVDDDRVKRFQNRTLPATSAVMIATLVGSISWVVGNVIGSANGFDRGFDVASRFAGDQGSGCLHGEDRLSAIFARAREQQLNKNADLQVICEGNAYVFVRCNGDDAVNGTIVYTEDGDPIATDMGDDICPDDSMDDEVIEDGDAVNKSVQTL